MKRGCERLAPLAVGLFLTACAAGPAPSANVPIPTPGPPGYIEFYCASCVTGLAVYEIQDGHEKHILYQKISQRPLDLLHNPVRLSDPDWGVRWYAAEAIGRLNGDVGEEIRARLQALASNAEYKRCLTNETTIQCSLVSEQAQQVLRMVGGEKDSLPSDHESPVLNDPRDRRQDF